MKRIVCTAMACIMLLGMLSVFPVSAATPLGTPVRTERDLLAMNTGGAYYLDADITLTQSYSKGTFTGTLDGNGHKIILSGNAVRSVFGRVEGTVKDITVEGKLSLTDAADTAALAVSASGRFERVVTNLDITVSAVNTCASPIAGIVGTVNGNARFIDCTNNGDIILDFSGEVGNRKAWIGGLVSFINGDITVEFEGCVNNGSVISKQKNTNVGGIVGWSQSANVIMTDCINNGALHTNATGYTGIGGMMGGMYNKNMQTKGFTAVGCVNNGKISGGDVVSVAPIAVNLYAGGMIGQVYSVGNISFDKCVNKAKIDLRTGTGGSAVGGMAGMFITVSSAWNWAGFDKADYVITNCVNAGELLGRDVGGIVAAGTQLGFNKDEISLTVRNCVNTAEVWGVGYAGGIIGRWANSEGKGWSSGTAKVTVLGCMNTGTVEGLSSAAGIFVYMESEGILSERANSTTLGSKIGDSLKVTLVENCVNAGEIICNSGKDNETKSRIAAGIVAHTNRKMTVKGCVNLGKLYMPVNDDPCLVNVIYTPNYVVGVKNIYLDSVSGLGDNATAVDESTLAASIGDTILAYDAPAIIEKISKAKALDAEDYEADSYAALMEVCQIAEAKFSSVTDITTVTQKSIATLNADFDEAFEGLVKLSGGSENDDGGDTPENNEGENDIPNENEGENNTPNENEDENNNIGSENGKDDDVENGGPEPTPENTDNKETDATTTKSTEATADTSKSGCGSTVGTAVLIVTAIFGLGLGIKSKKD